MILKQILCIIYDMAVAGYIHGDVHPGNFLVSLPLWDMDNNALLSLRAQNTTLVYAIDLGSCVEKGERFTVCHELFSHRELLKSGFVEKASEKHMLFSFSVLALVVLSGRVPVSRPTLEDFSFPISTGLIYDLVTKIYKKPETKILILIREMCAVLDVMEKALKGCF